ncbi:hypothetical protein [Microcoleus asticus]|uniref:Uncharacterized protein n=1 Tax=Microcoleus asticus IPMA8 TaxID=2563858 RepID=A0ABX2D947_9CYAN|nr:hypothetical protein [Microcoleus asticus]NQE38150.1 hypothetical protein [Microcoleus asticus IPMA8]
MNIPVVSTPYLQRIAEIRSKIEALKAEAEAIEPDAIVEGFDVLQSQQSRKQIVYNDANAKIVIQFRNQYDDQILPIQRLDEDIAREYENLCRSNAESIESSKAFIAELQTQLEEAEAKLETFLTSEHLKNLQKQRAIELKKTEFQVPKLAVYVHQLNR